MRRHTTVSVWWHMKKAIRHINDHDFYNMYFYNNQYFFLFVFLLFIIIIICVGGHQFHFLLPHKQKRHYDAIKDNKIKTNKCTEVSLYSITYPHPYLWNNENHDADDVLFVSCGLNEDCWMVVNPPFFFSSFFLFLRMCLLFFYQQIVVRRHN